MTSSEYAQIAECEVLNSGPRAILVRCPSFPEDSGFGQNTLWIHLGFIAPGQPDVEVGFSGTIVVHKRFVLYYKITGDQE